jgi:hypothetical protein
VAVENPSLVLAISKLAVSSVNPGLLSGTQMIHMLDSGLEVETLMELICWRLHGVPLPPVACGLSSHWIGRHSFLAALTSH